MSIEEELCTYLKSYPFDTFMKAWRRKVEQYGHAGGKISIELNDENRECISNFLGKNLHGLSSTEIQFKQVAKAIDNSRYEGADFNTVLKMYFDDELLTARQKEEIRKEEYSRIFSKLQEKYKDTKANEWLMFCINENKAVYHRMIQEIDLDSNKFQHDCDNVMKAINHFPLWQNQNMKLSVFAAQITGDPHAFDNNRFANYLLYHSICYFLDQPYERKTLLERNLQFYNIGLLQEDINNFCMIAHLSAFDQNKKTHDGWKDFYDRFEIWNVNALNLGYIDHIDSDCCERVLIIENPSVFQELVDFCKENHMNQFGLVCTNGNINYCGYLLLDKIFKAGIQMYYCGDFDPEGLLIAERLKDRYTDLLEFWHYTIKDYEISKSKNEIGTRRQAILDQLKYSQTMAIGNQLKCQKACAGYQENLLNEYKNDLLKWVKENETTK